MTANLALSITEQDLEQIIAVSNADCALILQAGHLQARSGFADGINAPLLERIRQTWRSFDDPELQRYLIVLVDGKYTLFYALELTEGVLLVLAFSALMALKKIRREAGNIAHALTRKQPGHVPDLMTENAPSAEVEQKTTAVKTSIDTDDPLALAMQSLFQEYPQPDPENFTDDADSGWQPEIFSEEDDDDENVLEPEKESSTVLSEAYSAAVTQTMAVVDDEPLTFALTDDDDQDDDYVPLAWKKQEEAPSIERETREFIDFLANSEKPATPLNVFQSPQVENDAIENTSEIGVANWHPINQKLVDDDDLTDMLQGDFEIDQLLHLNNPTPITLELNNDFSSELLYCPEDVQENTPETPAPTKTLLDELLTQEVDLNKTPQLHVAQALDEILYDITFYLVPRIPHHYLLGELAHRLRKWMPKICEAYQWKLLLISVRPDYLKWTLQDFKDSQSQDMLNVIRTQTSDYIFTDFPGLRIENPSGDYWSPSYLMDKENRYFSTQSLMSFVSKTRME